MSGTYTLAEIGDYGFSFQEEALDFFREYILAPADLKFDGEGLDLP